MARKVEFDFNAIAVLGLKFDLPRGGAAKIASNAGLGSERNENLISEGINARYIIFLMLCNRSC